MSLKRKINLFQLFLWSFRRNEKDVVNLYDSLAEIMKVITGGNALNFGLWSDDSNTPVLAQQNLCDIFGKMASLSVNQTILDVGSGFGSPALYWSKLYTPCDIICVDINYNQLDKSSGVNKLNSTATSLPFKKQTVDRILAFESPQHFKPLSKFLHDSHVILKNDGLLALAIPILKQNRSRFHLGLVYLTWSSEHYTLDFVTNVIKKCGFTILKTSLVGPDVYPPLARYYIKNRAQFKEKISEIYPSYVESVLFKSINKMNLLSEENIIDYVMVICKKS